MKNFMITFMSALVFSSCSDHRPASDYYSVQYRIQGAWTWTSLESVKGDLVSTDLPDHRVIILADETRIEIPLDGTQFVFSKERFAMIKRKMEQEAKQPIVTNTGQ